MKCNRAEEGQGLGRDKWTKYKRVLSRESPEKKRPLIGHFPH
jgi:hypothetical protein